jgi:hypothetical protein
MSSPKTIQTAAIKKLQELDPSEKLMQACSKGSPVLIARAIKAGANPNEPSSKTMRMPWVYLICRSDANDDERLAECLMVLMKAGMDPLKGSTGRGESILFYLQDDYPNCAVAVRDWVGEDRMFSHKHVMRSSKWWKNLDNLLAEKTHKDYKIRHRMRKRTPRDLFIA